MIGAEVVACDYLIPTPCLKRGPFYRLGLDPRTFCRLHRDQLEKHVSAIRDLIPGCEWTEYPVNLPHQAGGYATAHMYNAFNPERGSTHFAEGHIPE